MKTDFVSSVKFFFELFGRDIISYYLLQLGSKTSSRKNFRIYSLLWNFSVMETCRFIGKKGSRGSLCLSRPFQHLVQQLPCLQPRLNAGVTCIARQTNTGKDFVPSAPSSVQRGLPCHSHPTLPRGEGLHETSPQVQH